MRRGTRLRETLSAGSIPIVTMHANEVPTDPDLVRRLLASQYPELGGFPLEPVASSGTDNALYRLGDDLAVRLPRVEGAVQYLVKENRWTPWLAPSLSQPIPVPVAVGEPSEEFPFPWSVLPWLDGSTKTPGEVENPVQLAEELARFLGALRSLPADDGPRDLRGLPVRQADPFVRDALDGLRGEVDRDGVVAAWERVLGVADHEGPPIWFHGDLSPTNVLLQGADLAAVIDWGRCGTGDPAIDLVVAWNLLPTTTARHRLRDLLQIDDAAWERGKGWALTGIIGIPYYRETNPVLVEAVVRAIEAVLSD